MIFLPSATNKLFFRALFLPLTALALLVGNGCAKSPHPAKAEKPPQQPADSQSTAKKTNPAAWFGVLRHILPKKKLRPPAAQPANWAGVIRMVNVAENFALVESQSVSSTISGEKYYSVRQGVETGTLRMTSLKNPPFLIADILSGNPSPGDKIYLPSPTTQPVAPSSR